MTMKKNLPQKCGRFGTDEVKAALFDLILESERGKEIETENAAMWN